MAPAEPPENRAAYAWCTNERDQGNLTRSTPPAMTKFDWNAEPPPPRPVSGLQRWFLGPLIIFAAVFVPWMMVNDPEHPMSLWVAVTAGLATALFGVSLMRLGNWHVVKRLSIGVLSLGFAVLGVYTSYQVWTAPGDEAAPAVAVLGLVVPIFFGIWGGFFAVKGRWPFREPGEEREWNDTSPGIFS